MEDWMVGEIYLESQGYVKSVPSNQAEYLTNKNRQSLFNSSAG